MVTSGGVGAEISRQMTAVRRQPCGLGLGAPRGLGADLRERLDRDLVVLARPDARHHAVDEQHGREPAARAVDALRRAGGPRVARRGDHVLVERGQQLDDAGRLRGLDRRDVRARAPSRTRSRPLVAERLDPAPGAGGRRAAEPLREVLARGRPVARQVAARDLPRGLLGVERLERLRQREADVLALRRREDQLAAERDRLEQVAVAAAEARDGPASASSSRVSGPSASAFGTPVEDRLGVLRRQLEAPSATTSARSAASAPAWAPT